MHTWHDHTYIKLQQTKTVNDISHMHKPTSNMKRSIWPTRPSFARRSCVSLLQRLQPACKMYSINKTLRPHKQILQGMGCCIFWEQSGTVIPSATYYLTFEKSQMLFEPEHQDSSVTNLTFTHWQSKTTSLS